MKKRKIILIITLILFISLGVIFLNNPSEDVLKSPQALAIYIEEDGEYIPYKGRDLYPLGYHLNYNDTKCYDKENKEVSNLENYLEETDVGITLKSDITISCNLYFSLEENTDNESSNSLFYIKEDLNDKYTNLANNSYYLKLKENVVSYCLTEEDETSCDLKDIESLEITGNYTFLDSANGLKTVKVYIKDTEENVSLYEDDTIYFDDIIPECGDITFTQKENELVSGTIDCLDEGSGCVNEQISFQDVSLNTEVVIQDKAGNENSCLIKL